jgi:hypothetical protein
MLIFGYSYYNIAEEERPRLFKNAADILNHLTSR